MPQRLLLTAVAMASFVGLSACVQPSVRPIVGPDGSATLFISCGSSGECYELAGKSCPQGYDIQRARGATPESYLVSCRAAAATAAPAPSSAYHSPQYAPALAPAPAPSNWPPSSAAVDPQEPWSQDRVPAPPPPPPPVAPPEDYGQANSYASDLSIPRPIGSGEPDVGY